MEPQVLVPPSNMRLYNKGRLASVAASAVNTRTIEVGNNVHAILFYFASAVPAALTRAQLIVDVASIQIRLNGELIWDRTATEALDEYKWDFDKFGALAAPLGCIVCYFGNMGLPVWGQNRGHALGMLKSGSTRENPVWNTLEYTVTMTAGVATAATGDVRVLCDTYPAESTGLHIRRLRTTRNLAAAGDIFLRDLKKTPFAINAYHFVSAAGTIDAFTVKKDGREVIANEPIDVLNLRNDMAGKTPQAGYDSLNFNTANDLHGGERLRAEGVAEWEVIPHTTGAGGAATVILSEEVWDSIPE